MKHAKFILLCVVCAGTLGFAASGPDVREAVISGRTLGISEAGEKRIESTVGRTFRRVELRRAQEVPYAKGATSYESVNGPKWVGLGSIYPNPFNPSTTIEYVLAERGHVSLRIFNVSGRLVRTLNSGVQPSGVVHRMIWDGSDDRGALVPSGVYFSQLETTNLKQTKKMILLK